MSLASVYLSGNDFGFTCVMDLLLLGHMLICTVIPNSWIVIYSEVSSLFHE